MSANFVILITNSLSLWAVIASIFSISFIFFNYNFHFRCWQFNQTLFQFFLCVLRRLLDGFMTLAVEFEFKVGFIIWNWNLLGFNEFLNLVFEELWGKFWEFVNFWFRFFFHFRFGCFIILIKGCVIVYCFSSDPVCLVYEDVKALVDNTILNCKWLSTSEH
jgi:hypothetical protein